MFQKNVLFSLFFSKITSFDPPVINKNSEIRSLFLGVFCKKYYYKTFRSLRTTLCNYYFIMREGERDESINKFVGIFS